MHYNLLFNGCSWTFGSELEGINNDIEYRRTHRYSHLVAERFGLTYCNLGAGGSSNESILRRTFEWFEQGNTCDHAIIQWTERIRRDFFMTDNDFINLCPPKESAKKGRYWQQIVELRKHYCYMQDNSNDQYNQDMCITWMKCFLKDKCSVFHLKLNKEPTVCSLYYNNSPYHKYVSDIKLHYIVNNIINIQDTQFYCYPIKKQSHLNGGHPNEFGHLKIANYILDNDDYFKTKRYDRNFY